MRGPSIASSDGEMLPSVLVAALQDLQLPGRRVFNRKPKSPSSEEPSAGLRALGDRRLILVSNREPYARRRGADGVRFERTAGGLVTALDPVMRASGGTWIALGSAPAQPGPAIVALSFKSYNDFGHQAARVAFDLHSCALQDGTSSAVTRR